MNNSVKLRVSYRSWFLRATAGALVLSLAGCGAAASSSVTKPVILTAAQGPSVNLLVSPSPPTARHQVIVTVSITGTQSKTKKVHDVWISETMPGMSMPKMDVSLKPADGHRFSNTTLFVMQGAWRIFVHFKVGSSAFTRSFSLKVKA